MHDGRTELRLLLDMDTERGPVLLPIPLHVWVAGGLAAAAERARQEAEFQARVHGLPTGGTGALERVGLDCAPLVSLVLYLCSTAAELRDAKGSDRVPRRPRSAPGRAANAPTVWEAGYRIGPALRVALERERTTPGGDGTHETPERTIGLRWLPPIPVAVDDATITPTVRRV